jgi:hypothetical protein
MFGRHWQCRSRARRQGSPCSFIAATAQKQAIFLSTVMVHWFSVCGCPSASVGDAATDCQAAAASASRRRFHGRSSTRLMGWSAMPFHADLPQAANPNPGEDGCAPRSAPGSRPGAKSASRPSPTRALPSKIGPPPRVSNFEVPQRAEKWPPLGGGAAKLQGPVECGMGGLCPRRDPNSRCGALYSARLADCWICRS